ncbi:hypothetical protein B0H15DRAFT_798177 [Mycena belliarum]|uniref:Uncharacterized protein n=1 Tax=Mycena belliarum TaxID=1033014 RepID=A0AAD6UBF7_9AGAR|nr:hypothetical protein B0H15DRAFT_798177 [Mycena belliae]
MTSNQLNFGNLQISSPVCIDFERDIAASILLELRPASGLTSNMRSQPLRLATFKVQGSSLNERPISTYNSPVRIDFKLDIGIQLFFTPLDLEANLASNKPEYISLFPMGETMPPCSSQFVLQYCEVEVQVLGRAQVRSEGRSTSVVLQACCANVPCFNRVYQSPNSSRSKLRLLTSAQVRRAQNQSRFIWRLSICCAPISGFKREVRFSQIVSTVSPTLTYKLQPKVELRLKHRPRHPACVAARNADWAGQARSLSLNSGLHGASNCRKLKLNLILVYCARYSLRELNLYETSDLKPMDPSASEPEDLLVQDWTLRKGDVPRGSENAEALLERALRTIDFKLAESDNQVQPTSSFQSPRKPNFDPSTGRGGSADWACQAQNLLLNSGLDGASSSGCPRLKLASKHNISVRALAVAAADVPPPALAAAASESSQRACSRSLRKPAERNNSARAGTPQPAHRGASPPHHAMRDARFERPSIRATSDKRCGRVDTPGAAHPSARAALPSTRRAGPARHAPAGLFCARLRSAAGAVRGLDAAATRAIW